MFYCWPFSHGEETSPTHVLIKSVVLDVIRFVSLLSFGTTTHFLAIARSSHCHHFWSIHRVFNAMDSITVPRNTILTITTTIVTADYSISPDELLAIQSEMAPIDDSEDGIGHRIRLFCTKATSKILPDALDPKLRPCPQHYMGEKSRGLFKSARQFRHDVHKDPIFKQHEANIRNRGNRAPWRYVAFPRPTINTLIISPPLHLTIPTVNGIDETGAHYHLTRDKAALIDSINSVRVDNGLLHLKYLAFLDDEAQAAADRLDVFCELDDPLDTMFGITSVMDVTVPKDPSDDTSSVYSTELDEPVENRRRGQLIGPAGLGGLSTGQLWRSGKYKRHVHPVERVCVGLSAAIWRDVHHVDDVERAMLCPCHTYNAYAAIADHEWNYIGVGRSEHSYGKWFVHLST